MATRKKKKKPASLVDKIALRFLRVNLVLLLGVVNRKPAFSTHSVKLKNGKEELVSRMWFPLNVGKGKPQSIDVILWGRRADKARNANVREGTCMLVHGKLKVRKAYTGYNTYVEGKEIQVIRQAVPAGCRVVHKSVWDKLDPLERELGEVGALSLFGENIGDDDEVDPDEYFGGDE
jgi:hypothetical protein